MLPELHALRVLMLGFCCLMCGCGPEGMHIISISLMIFDVVTCIASGDITLEYMSRLIRLSTGVQPLMGKGLLRLLT